MIKHANPFGLRVPIKMSYRNIKNWMGINNSKGAELMTALLWSLCFMCKTLGKFAREQEQLITLLLEGRCADLYRCLSSSILPTALPLEDIHCNHLLNEALQTSNRIPNCWVDTQRGYQRSMSTESVSKKIVTF